ncbi:TPA: AAA family ATPase [Vibrio harveyi]|uniref:AAA family ATPase n=1 Tax=Vibrio sp. Y29_XK_CS5 TaxID=2957762 RepID=UPI0020A26055|nr:AAA family ATPase [Vibrio sp. Y29_XK_CS5]HDM8170194.1 AAA family ATPase [Vibrio harveyi]
MLSDLSIVSKLFFDESESSWFFDEIAFDDEAVAKLKQLPLDLEFFEHSARLKTSDSSHAYLPCHYFLYALKVRPLALMLCQYVSLKQDIVSTLLGNNKAKATALEKLVTSAGQNTITNALDAYSRENFFNFFKDTDKRLGAKDPINSGRGVIRTDRDIFGSVILKALPVPDESSNALGRLIYAFSKSPQVYEYLINRYACSLPYIFKSNNGDELLYLIFVTLGLENHFTTIFSGLTSTARMCAIGTVADALLLNTTPVSGNPSYFDTPIHYSTALKAYVFFKKGLLDEDTLLGEISSELSSFWPYTFIDKDADGFYLKAVSSNAHVQRVTGACNTIIYGAPGTGKSHSIEKNTDEKFIVRTVFHPETQYSDFVGCLKPVMEGDRVAYGFRPGAFTEALVKAVNDPGNEYSLVIEEINRAPAAAVFGEIFQLLDRKSDGSSCYKIDISDPDLLSYLNTQTGSQFLSGKLSIPSNLSLLATMNSSDQAVMPLDTAFKRRWSFEYVELSFAKAPTQVLELQTSEGLFKISWANFADEVLNTMLKEFRVPEDRMIGPFFLNETELQDWQSALRSKLFVYLWDDVLRHKTQDRARLFSDKFGTFGELYNSFPKAQVFGVETDALIRKFGTAVENLND